MDEARRRELIRLRRAALLPPIICQHCGAQIARESGYGVVYVGDECQHDTLHAACRRECPTLPAQFAAYMQEVRGDA